MASRESTESRRRQIVEATLELLADHSLDGLSTRQIARTLGLSQPALFRHFRSRDDLVLAAIEHARKSLEDEIRAIVASNGPAIEGLLALAGVVTRQAERTPGLPRLLFSEGMAAGPKVRLALRGVVSMHAALATELFREAQRQGAVRADVDAKRAGAAFVALIQGSVLQWQLTDRTTSLPDTVTAAASLLLHGASDKQGATRVSGLEPGDVNHASVSHPAVSHLAAVDARAILAGGVDPLEAILGAIDGVGASGAVVVVAPFRPVPLIALLGRKGHGVGERPGPGGTTIVEIVNGGDPPLVDLSDLSPPEPLERVLHEVSALPPGGVFLARVPRVPRFLFPHLRDRGVAWEVLEEEDGAALLRIVRNP